jgi:hypothetical protein
MFFADKLKIDEVNVSPTVRPPTVPPLVDVTQPVARTSIRQFELVGMGTSRVTVPACEVLPAMRGPTPYF